MVWNKAQNGDNTLGSQLKTNYIEMCMAQINEKLDLNNSNRTKKYEKDWRLELFALIGFCFSGAIFIVSGLKNGDVFTIIGSLVWITSCVIWMIPYRKYFDSSKYNQSGGCHIARQIEPDK